MGLADHGRPELSDAWVGAGLGSGSGSGCEFGFGLEAGFEFGLGFGFGFGFGFRIGFGLEEARATALGAGRSRGEQRDRLGVDEPVAVEVARGEGADRRVHPELGLQHRHLVRGDLGEI